jgi:succinate dehydrogenase/fumarate reductase flavoprotein subunit
MGGAKVDENWQSTLPGLFMVGENAAGIHGANRLGQNALTDLLVSGRRAGIGAARLAAEIALPDIDPSEAEAATEPALKMLNSHGGVRPTQLRGRLRSLMWDSAGVYRTERSLKAALEEIDGLRLELENQSLTVKSRRYNRELIEGLENHFLLATARCVIESAIERTESRGSHYREDYQETDNKNWLEHIVIRSVDENLKTERIPVDLRELRPEEEMP